MEDDEGTEVSSERVICLYLLKCIVIMCYMYISSCHLSEGEVHFLVSAFWL